MRGDADDVLAVAARIVPAATGAQARDRLQRGGLARAVAADEGDDLALVDGERDAFQRLDLAVADVDVARAQAAPGAPR